jgi:hypothetical protein
MAITARPAVRRDIRDVMSNLSDISKSELDNAKYTIKAAQRLFVTTADAHSSTAILQDGELIAVVLASQPEAGVSNTMFMAKQRFFEGVAPTRFLRRWVAETLSKFPIGTVIRSETWSAHKDVSRWYELLGYHASGRFNGMRRFEISKTKIARHS